MLGFEVKLAERIARAMELIDQIEKLQKLKDFEKLFWS